MNKKNKYPITAYILAGGESRRFGGKIKGLQLFKGQPLITHCIKRLMSQTDEININTHLLEFSEFHCPIIADDPEHLYRGPLSGLLASMQHFHQHNNDNDWLLLVPCDSPFIPKNLVQTLLKSIDNSQHKAACILYKGELQPTFSLWHKDLLPQIEDAVINKKWGGLKIFFKQLNNIGCVVEYPEQALNPFLNINNQDELKQAQLIQC